MNDQELLDELNERINAHYHANGYMVRMLSWACVYGSVFYPMVDGELVGVDRIRCVDFFPVGEFRCGACYEVRPCDSSPKNHAFFQYDDNCMICADCNKRLARYANPPYPRMSCRLSGVPEFAMDDLEFVNIVDVPNPHKEARQFKQAVKRARAVAASMGKHFVEGMCAADIWRAILAFRVLRAFKRCVSRRVQARVGFVLSMCTPLNPAAALDIAKNHVRVYKDFTP